MHSQNQFSATRVNVPSNPVGLDPSVKALLEANRETNQRLDKLLGIMAQHVGPTV